MRVGPWRKCYSDPIYFTGFAARHWYRLSPMSLLLYPFGLVYGLVVRLRRLLYRLNVVTSVRLPVPVIVVGNLTVGGTGKTPLVLWLAAGLQHYRMRRDLEIAVEDERGHGNGLLLPAGPLRASADRPVDATVLNDELA